MMFQSLDLKTKKLLLLFLSLLCWRVLFAPGTCSASGTPDQTQTVYQITEQELTTLETNLAQLRSINESLQRELQAQKRELHVLRQESGTLLNQLQLLRQRSETQQNLLINANKSLAEYATEAKRERLRIKAQRNTWEAVAACAIIALAVK
ncbi:MAG: hypothetical protein IJV12_00600 [Acidaminococcaceae bacterium]|nr:hypothetical protein [Acidaminococcaceae bacterium]